MSSPYIKLNDKGGVGHIILDRPKALNALDADMMIDMRDALLEWRDNPHIDYVLLEHSGGRGFCAGGDLKVIAKTVAENSPQIDMFPAIEFNTNILINDYPKPYISIIDGICMGAGLGVSIYGSTRIATAATIVAMPEINIGLYPDIGACRTLPRLAGALGRFLCLTGSRLAGRDAACAGIATHYAPPEILEKLRSALRNGETNILDRLEQPKMSELSFADQLPELERVFSCESVEDMLAQLQKQSFPLAAEAERKMREGAPRSVALTARLITIAAEAQNLSDHMRMEYRIIRRMLRAPDFSEGVRAMLIDKDQPRWNPARIEDIDKADIETLFAPPENGVELC